MGTTFKPVVHAHQKRKDGTYNVKIRVTHNRQSRFLATNVTVAADQLSRGLKIKDQRVLDALDRTVRKMRDIVTELGFEAVAMDIDELVAKIRAKLKEGEAFKLDFYEYGIAHAGTRKKGTRVDYEAALAAMLRYTDNIHPDIGDITANWLRGYLAFLSKEVRFKEGARAGKTISADTICMYWSKLSKVYTLAKQEFNDEEHGLIKIPGNPFAAVDPPERSKLPKHLALPRDIIQQIIDLRPEARENSARNLARDMFLVSFTMQGMNLTDLWDAIDEPPGYITFVRKKTMDRHPVKLRVKIERETRAILARYMENGLLLGRLRNRYKSYHSFYSSAEHGIQRLTKAIGKKVTFYAARHSWATLASNDCGVDKWTVHEALSHADRATAIDDIYIAKDYTKYWKANRAVLDLFVWSRR